MMFKRENCFSCTTPQQTFRWFGVQTEVTSAFRRKAGATSHPRLRAVSAISLACALLGGALAEHLSGAETGQPPRALLINSLGPEFAPWNTFAADFRTELQSQSLIPPEIYEVSLESARFSNPQEEPVVKYVQSLFHGHRLDLVVPVGGPAVRFAQKYRQELFTGTPMLMAAVDQRHLQNAALTSNDTAVAVLNDLPRMIENILHLLPLTTNVFVVIGDSPLEQFWHQTLLREFQPFTNRLTFGWGNTLSLPEMLKRSAALPPRSAIFYPLLAVDAAGVSHGEDRALTKLRTVANAPIFGLQSTQMGRGIVGGPLVSISDLSRKSASVAARILRGERPADIKTPAVGPGEPTFDWRELQRWGIRTASLPAGSIVLFRKPTVWQQYRGRIVAVGLVVIAQASIIAGLLANLVKRRRAERSLAESETRFQVAADAAPVMIWLAGTDKLCSFFNKGWLEFTGRTMEQELGNGWTQGVHPDDLAACLNTYEQSFNARRPFAMDYRIRTKNGEYVWVLDKGTPRFSGDGTFVGYVGCATDITALKRAEERWRIVVESAPSAMLVVNAEGRMTMVNARVETLFGYKRSELIGESVDMLVPDSICDNHRGVRECYLTNPSLRSVSAAGELFGRRKDGSSVPIEIGLNRFRTPEGEFVLASIIDVTQRLAAEATLRESEERMTLAAEAANLGMWVWEPPETYMWTSAKWKKIHGYSPDEDIRYDALIERVHPVDREAIGHVVTDAFKNQGAFHLQHRVVLPNGTVRWISTSGRVEQTANDGPLRLLGISIDISERVEVEAAAREVSGKLITAQEDERRRIARDLHDDLNQRLAMLSVGADLLGRMDNPARAHALITDIASQVQNLSAEVHKLSYRLHPAKLDQLGLLAAARSFCHELSKQCGVEVEFVHEDMPRDLNDAAALCLYRIIQEGLQNVFKHSGATRARVELSRHEDLITLAVSDNGCGFDMSAIGHQAGLGLVGMRERVRLMHGQIVFQSTPGQGTRIEVTIPVTLSQTAAA